VPCKIAIAAYGIAIDKMNMDPAMEIMPLPFNNIGSIEQTKIQTQAWCLFL